MRSLFKVVSSSYVTAGLILCLISWYLIFRIRGGFEGLWEPFNLKAFRLFYGILCLNVLLLSISSFFSYSKKRLRAILPAVFLFMLLSGAYVYMHHFEGTIAIGEGEGYIANPSQFRYLSMGPSAQIPVLDFIMRTVEPSMKEGRAEVVKDGNIIEFGKEGLMMEGYRVGFPKTGPSLLFHLFIKNENSIEQSYVKLDLDPPHEEDSFMFFMLPYEFFVRKSGTEGSFMIDVRRGKRSLYEGVIENYGKVEVEEIVLTLVNTRKYAVLRISRYPGINIFFFSAVLFLLTAGAAVVKRFRRAGGEEKSR